MSTPTTSQSNVPDLQISFGLWIVIILIGASVGLVGGLLMKLLRVAQHLGYSYRSGDLLLGVEKVSGLHRVIVMVFVGFMRCIYAH